MRFGLIDKQCKTNSFLLLVEIYPDEIRKALHLRRWCKALARVVNGIQKTSIIKQGFAGGHLHKD